MSADVAEISGASTMAAVLEAYPGARRALFKKFHIGGCSSCGFQITETLQQLCERNGGLATDDVLDQILKSHAIDEAFWIEPNELHRLMAIEPRPVVYDIRSGEEHAAVHISGSHLLDRDAMTQLLGFHPRDQLLALYDHLGTTALDAAAYFSGHGFENVRCLRGGIDAWAREVEPSLPRYRIEQ